MAASYCTYGHNKAAMPFSEIDLAIVDFSTKLNFMIIYNTQILQRAQLFIICSQLDKVNMNEV